MTIDKQLRDLIEGEAEPVALEEVQRHKVHETDNVSQLDARKSGFKSRLAIAAALVSVGLLSAAGLYAVTRPGDTARTGVAVETDSVTTLEKESCESTNSCPLFTVKNHDVGPLQPRTDVGLVALPDGRVAVWGGDLEGSTNHGRPEVVAYSDGAIYDPVAKSWQMMSPTDLLEGDPFGNTRGVLMGDEVLWIRDNKKAAVWSIATDSWRQVASPPEDIAELFWTGDVVVASRSNAYYDPDTDEWQSFSSSTGEYRDSFWQDGRLYTLHGSGDVTSLTLTGESVDLAESLTGNNADYEAPWQLGSLGWYDDQLVVARGLKWDVWLVEPQTGSVTLLPPAPFGEMKDWATIAPSSEALLLINSVGDVAIYEDAQWKLEVGAKATSGEIDGSSMWRYGLDHSGSNPVRQPIFTSTKF